MRIHILAVFSCSFAFAVACGSNDEPSGAPTGTNSTTSSGSAAGATGAGGRGGTGGGGGTSTQTTGDGGGAGPGGSSGAAGAAVGNDAGADASRSDAATIDAPAEGGSDAGDGQVACPVAPKPACTATDLLGKLRCVPGVTAQTNATPPAGYQRFDISIEQPVDHTNPAGAKFQQRIVLLHRSATAPLVLSTSGYGLSTGLSEVTTTFAANQISIEHRFFTPSVPAGPVPWDYLTIAQSAGDSHHIWEAFKWLYPGKWANTGGSKGGETAVYHRRFHSCDVDATVAYVAPLVYGLEDQRFVTFLENVGGATYAACRTKLLDLTKALLMRRDEIVPKMDPAAYTRLGRDVSYEHAVMDLIFAFWQYQPASRCNTLPAPTASADALFTFMTDIGVIGNADDSSFDYFAPYFFQTGLELGLPANYDMPFTSLLKFPGTYTLDNYLPAGVKPVFRPEAMPDVQNWVKTSGQRLMYVYGELDPWSSGAYDLGAAADSFKFIAPGGNHGSGIGDLKAADKEMALSTLERWLGVTRVRTPSIPTAPHNERQFLRR
jgi:hypothetical protein